MEEIAKKEKCLVLRLSNYEGNILSIVDFSDFITANLKRELLSKKPLENNLQNAKDWILSLKPIIGWNDINLSIERKQVVQELLRQRLKKLWNEINKDFTAAIILFDEAESLERIEGIFPFLREVLQRLSTDTKYMVVLAGKLNFPERMSESFSPLNRFFPTHKLNPLTYEEIKTYIEKKLNTVNVKIDENVLKLLASSSEGHPYVLVSMAYTLFDSLGEDENVITEEVVTRSKPKIDAQLEQDFFLPMHHPLTPKAKDILTIISKKLKVQNFHLVRQ